MPVTVKYEQKDAHQYTFSDVVGETRSIIKEVDKKLSTTISKASWGNPTHRLYKSVRRRRR